MGWRFRRTKQILPGVRLNFNKNSTSITFGGRGAKYTISSTGKKTASVGIPGTGLSYSTTVGNRRSSPAPVEMMDCPKCETQIEAALAICPHCQSKLVRIGGGQFSEWWPLILLLICVNFALQQLTGGTWMMFYVFAALSVVFLVLLISVQTAKKRTENAAFVRIRWRLRFWYVLPLWFVAQIFAHAINIISYLQ